MSRTGAGQAQPGGQGQAGGSSGEWSQVPWGAAGAVLATATALHCGGRAGAAPVLGRARTRTSSWMRKRLGGGKGGFSSLGREPVRTARRGWRRRGGKHRLCKKRNWSYRRLVLSQLSSGPWVTLEVPWEGACHPCQRLSPSSGHARVPWEASSAAQIPKDPNEMCLLEGFIGRLELLREEFVGENTFQAARRLGLLVCRLEGPWRVPAEAGTPGHRQSSRQGSMPRWWSSC